MTTAFVVDVNVAIVANGRAEQADGACVSACLDVLEEIYKSGIVVLDDGMRILTKYMDHLSMAGQPGAGDFFMKWVWENQAVVSRCERVHLECKNGDSDNFVLFPQDLDLCDFDKSDRKYVAAALASRRNPEVLNAVDTDWWKHKDALARNGIKCRFLCPQCMVLVHCLISFR